MVNIDKVMKLLISIDEIQKSNLNHLINYNNKFIDKLIEIEEKSCHQNCNSIKEEFEEKKKELLLNKRNPLQPHNSIQQIIDLRDKQLKEIEQQLSILRWWSGKNIYSIVFDSNIHGDGSNNVLLKKVINKSHLYFITFDDQQNVFGGYLNERISEYDVCIGDPNSFVFSLKRNDLQVQKKFLIHPNKHRKDFKLFSNKPVLYRFGTDGGNCKDITIHKVGEQKSYCLPYAYDYNGENQPLTDGNYCFSAQRIIVIEMN
ncbi:TLDc domain-containing protein [Entamoeba marina]